MDVFDKAPWMDSRRPPRTRTVPPNQKTVAHRLFATIHSPADPVVAKATVARQQKPRYVRPMSKLLATAVNNNNRNNLRANNRARPMRDCDQG
jgi:hypothetical protein